MHDKHEVKLAIENGRLALERLVAKHERAVSERGDMEEYEDLLVTHGLILSVQSFLTQVYNSFETD